MIEAYGAADVRAAEAPLLERERGFAGGLMHRAATALAAAVRSELLHLRGRVAGASVVALVGAGNNGGDALHALALLARHGVRVCAVTTTSSVHEGGLAALVAARGRVVAIERLETSGPGAAGERVWLGDALAEAFAADVVLDGLLGVGARGGLREPAARLVTLLAELLAAADDGRGPRGGRPVVVAVDLPSGIGVDDGAVPGPVLPADRTVTFGALKPGLLLPPARQFAGRVQVVDLGLGPGLAAADARPVVAALEARDVARLWPVPAATGHKYSRGVVGVVAGTAAYPGAAVLAVAGALGAGCGMVRYLGPDAVGRAVVAAHPEVVVGEGRVQAWVLGPGTGAGDEQADRLRTALDRALDDGVPAVVDAGALALVAGRQLGPHVVLTPHAGELARLLSGVDGAAGTAGGGGASTAAVERAEVEAEPLRWARAAHEATGATVLLKGPVTVVVGEAGVLAQADAPPWLATAGAGDVLAGVLGAVLAGRSDDVRHGVVTAGDLAALAAVVHGRAAEEANPGGPITASGVAAAVARVVAGLLR